MLKNTVAQHNNMKFCGNGWKTSQRMKLSFEVESICYPRHGQKITHRITGNIFNNTKPIRSWIGINNCKKVWDTKLLMHRISKIVFHLRTIRVKIIFARKETLPALPHIKIGANVLQVPGDPRSNIAFPEACKGLESLSAQQGPDHFRFDGDLIQSTRRDQVAGLSRILKSRRTCYTHPKSSYCAARLTVLEISTDRASASWFPISGYFPSLSSIYRARTQQPMI